MSELLRIENLGVELPTGPAASVQAVKSVSMVVRAGERIGLVGESGSGKSVTGRAIAGLLPQSPRVKLTGSLCIEGREMVGAPANAYDIVRRKTVSMIFQDPLSSLNPTMRVGQQIREAIEGPNKDARMLEAMARAGLPDPEATAKRFAFELSGGLRQRVLIAIAIAKAPKLVIADEPTTALDVTVQAKVIATLDQSVRETGSALIMISHDLALVAKLCDRIYVMEKGHLVEEGETLQIFRNPQHPYTRHLIAGARDLLSVPEV